MLIEMTFAWTSSVHPDVMGRNCFLWYLPFVGWIHLSMYDSLLKIPMIMRCDILFVVIETICRKTNNFVTLSVIYPWSLKYASRKWVIIGSGNGLSPVQCQANTWSHAGLLSIGLLGKSFREIELNFIIFIKENVVQNAVCQMTTNFVQREMSECPYDVTLSFLWYINVIYHKEFT